MFIDIEAILTLAVIIAGGMVMRLVGYDLNKIFDWCIEVLGAGTARLKEIMNSNKKTNGDKKTDGDKKD